MSQRPTQPEQEPDIADEAGPKESEFHDKKDAEQMTNADFDAIP